jgi:flagellar motor switch protein FliM
LTLPLQVRLEACEVDIGRLQDLQPGDVVRLPHRLDAPAAVVGPGGQPLFGGYLVRRRGRKAVELAPVGAAPTTRVAGETP